MPKIALQVAYDGNNYKGYQIQINGITVQEKLEEAILKVTREKCRVFCAGRTDTGVHALGQVVAFTTGSQLGPPVLLRALNATLPFDIRITDCAIVADDFNPRRDAQRKTYGYILNTARVADPLMLKRAWHIPWPLDLQRLQVGAELLRGQHNFKAFAASGCTTRTHHRNLEQVDVHIRDHFVTLQFTADGFLYNMVRIMTGTLVEYASGKIATAIIQEALLGKEGRYALGQTAPPHGLYLQKVEYPQDIFSTRAGGSFFLYSQ